MKINNLYGFNRKFNTVSFGEVFSCKDAPDDYFMKILPIESNNYCYNAVDLKSGTPVYVDNKDQVKIYKDAELEINS